MSKARKRAKGRVSERAKKATGGRAPTKDRASVTRSGSSARGVRIAPTRPRTSSPTPTPARTASGRRVTVQRRAGAAVAVAERKRRKDAARAQALIRDIAERFARVERNLCAIGRSLRTLSDQRLYLALGYGSFGEMLDVEGLCARATAYKLMAIAEHYRPGEAKALGLDKAYLLMRLTEATGARRTPAELLAADAVIGGKPISDLSVRDLSRELRSARARGGAPGRPPPPEARAAWDAAADVQKALRSRGAMGATADARRISGRWRIVIELDPAHAKLLLGR